MKANLLAFCLALALTGCALAQDAAPASTTPAGTQAAAQLPEQAGINTTLKAYANAYGSRNINDLVAVWPDLPNQKKDYKKIKEHLTDTKVSHDSVTFSSCETQVMKDNAVTKCDRTEEYIKTEMNTTYSGDAMMASPAQRPPPTTQEKKTPVKKTETVWVKLHKNGDNWQIVSVSDKPQTL